MRHTSLTLLLSLCLLASCQSVPFATHIPTQSPEAQRVNAALALWPKPAVGDALRRPFFATLHVAGIRTTATGVLEYHGPRDFRVVAVTEAGMILFDGRVNWGGVALLRQMPGIDTGSIEAMLTDMVRAFDLPPNLDNMAANDAKVVVTRRLADTHNYTWIFNKESGRLLETQVDLGLLDTLKVSYEGYSARGWPKELQVSRHARLYDVNFSFTDDAVVESQGK